MKRWLKEAVRAAFKILVLPVVLAYRLQSLLIDKDKAFYGYSQLMSLFPGMSGEYLRYGFYAWTLERLGHDACICFGTTFSHSGTRVGDRVYIGPHSNIGLSSIGNDVLIGTGVHILSGMSQHGYEDLETPIREQTGSLLQVTIGGDSWIGNKAVVAAHVGQKCIVGAAALVHRDIPDYSVAVGNPAHVVKSRLPSQTPS